VELLISCSELYERLGDDDVLVLDVRSEADWEALPVHLPGALRLAPEELATAIDMLPDDELIALCGTAGAEADARRASHLLRRAGRAARVLAGGLHAWILNGLPTERHAAHGLDHAHGQSA
jgi:rhodanese-related sulfurtransferase